MRTWDAEGIGQGDTTQELLDKAHALGLTVTVGIWLEHERHGFDYGDPDQVAEQFEKARSIVERYKDHPAVLHLLDEPRQLVQPRLTSRR